MTLAVGSVAPDFTLPVRPREASISLSDFRGEKRVVLLFFPLAFSSVCTKEMCAVAENYAAWEDLDAQVIGISVDSPYANVKFAEECGAPFPIASDFNKAVSPLYDALAEDMGGLKGVTKRLAYVIDRSGVIVYAWEGEHPGVMPDFEAIMEAVGAAS